VLDRIVRAVVDADGLLDRSTWLITVEVGGAPILYTVHENTGVYESV
jgi:hypothetical protein